jgi:hypothetical protein
MVLADLGDDARLAENDTHDLRRMNWRLEIRGTIRRAKLSLLGARQALLSGIEDGECMLTPDDMRSMRAELKDMTVLLKDVKEACGKFGGVADARELLVV